MSAKSLTWFMNFDVMPTINGNISVSCEACLGWVHEFYGSVSLHDLQEQAYLHYLNCRKAYQQ